jgi:hypothetical protein
MIPIILLGPTPSLSEISKDGPYVHLSFPNYGNVLGNLSFAHIGSTRSSSYNVDSLNDEKGRLVLLFITANELLNEPGLKSVYVHNRPENDYYAICILYKSILESIEGFKRIKLLLREIDPSILVDGSKRLISKFKHDEKAMLIRQEKPQVMVRALSPAAGPYEQAGPAISETSINAISTEADYGVVETVHDPVVVLGNKGISF